MQDTKPLSKVAVTLACSETKLLRDFSKLEWRLQVQGEAVSDDIVSQCLTEWTHAVRYLAQVYVPHSCLCQCFDRQPETVSLLVLMHDSEICVWNVQVTAEAEGMALEICAAETTVEMLTKEEQSTCKQQLFNLVYTHATNHFQQRNYDSASRFFSAAHMYSEEGNKAKTARVLAVCNLGMKALDRALEYVDIATQTEPTSVFNAFLRLKVHLLQKDCRAAANQVQAMMKCEDFTHEILRVAAQEAMGAEQTVVAKQALLQLWDLVEKDSNGTFQPGDQAVIMSNLVKITQDDQSDVSLYMDELSAIYNQGADRLEEVGYDGFFGADTSGSTLDGTESARHAVEVYDKVISLNNFVQDFPLLAEFARKMIWQDIHAAEHRKQSISLS
ncbi:TPA: hypothetical protein ACH3X3_000186 [Trebouxia sp. C0006]